LVATRFFGAEPKTASSGRNEREVQMASDLKFADNYLAKWDRFAQGENELVPFIRDNKDAFEAALARVLLTKDKRGPARLVFYAVVQIGGFIPLQSESGKASASVLGPDFPVFTSKERTRAYFAGELYYWWLDNCDQYAAFPLFDEWSQREFARAVVVPMYKSTRNQKSRPRRNNG
jgi:hypothetical protein